MSLEVPGSVKSLTRLPKTLSCLPKLPWRKWLLLWQPSIEAPSGISREQRDRALSRFLQDCDEHFLILPVDRPIIDRAVELTQDYRLRGYDAVQLATALVNSDLLQSAGVPLPVFVASDDDLLVAAKAEQFSIDNPLRHADLDSSQSAE